MNEYEYPYLVYFQKLRTSKVYIVDSTMVSPYSLLLFGGEIEVNHRQECISVDHWIQFRAPARIAVLIREIRKAVDILLQKKIDNATFEISSNPLIQLLIHLLNTDGISG